MTGGDAMVFKNRTITHHKSPHPTRKRPHSHRQILTTTHSSKPSETGQIQKENPKNPKDSPQLTTNPKHPSLPQRIGPTTTLDFPYLQNPIKKIRLDPFNPFYPC
jgi:hypothetical protein